jgi:hypothetical protein
MVVLGQPQHLVLAFTFFPDEQRVTIQTVENSLTDLNGEYKFTSSPDGAKTLVTYTGTAKDKVKMPIPLALQKSALRETFIATIQALKKGLAAQLQGSRTTGAS